MKIAAQTFSFDVAPDPGQVVMVHGQRYEMVRAEPYELPPPSGPVDGSGITALMRQRMERDGGC